MRVTESEAELRDGRRVVFRSPEREDAAASLTFVRTLSAESFRYLNHPPSFFHGMSLAAQEGFLDKCLAHPRGFMVSAFMGSQVIGNADLQIEGGSFSAHVGQLGLGVLNAWQRQGLGQLLMQRLIEVATANGVNNLTLRVRAFNDRAIRLYERLGFERVGTLRAIVRLPDGEADEHVYQRIANS